MLETSAWFLPLAYQEPLRLQDPQDVRSVSSLDRREVGWPQRRVLHAQGRPNTFTVNNRSQTRIWGPKKWSEPRITDKEEMVWVREKVQGSKEQYFTCHEKGIGRLYDSRRPRYYRIGRCKFPAGHGWKIRSRRDCLDTSLEITHVGLDDTRPPERDRVQIWSRSRPDHICRYVPNQGMTNAWKQ